MGDLANSKIRVLGDFARIADAQGLTHVVIGAGARVLLCEMVDLDPGRLTKDWDLAVPLKNWEAFHALVKDLALVPGAPFLTMDVEHRFVHRETNMLLDLIPFGGVEEAPGRLIWPGGQQMDVSGMDLALQDCERIDFGSPAPSRTTPVRERQRRRS